MSTLAVALSPAAMLDEEAKSERAAAARLVLAKAIAEIPENLELTFVEYDDKLTNEQVAELLTGENETSIDTLDEWESENRHHGEQYQINEIRESLDDEERDLLDDVEDELREALWEADKSDPFGDLIRRTPDKWLRYWIDERDLDTDELIDRVFIGVNGVGEVLDALGLLGTDQHTPELEQEIADVLAESGSANAIYLLWHGDIEAPIRAAAYDFGSDPKTMSTTVTFKDPYLLLFNPFNGSGYAERIHVTITRQFDPDHIKLDERGGGGGYSFTDETCGGWHYDGDTTVTFNREDDPS